MTKHVLFLIVATFFSQPLSAFAQASGGGQPLEVSLTVGPLLPSRVPLIREILLGVDFRVTAPTSKGTFEIDGYFANGDGANYRTVSIDYRADLGGDVFPAFFLIGGHADFYTPSDETSRFAGGWHFGGGAFQPLFEGVSLREDFRYRFGPGQSLLIGLGLSYQFSL